MGVIINYQLLKYNKELAEQFFADANERNCELFFAVGVDVKTKDMHLFYNHIGGVERIIETMEHMTKALKEAQAKKKK